ncbi:MAG: ABC transporter permease [Rhodospirillaceae bacterium]|jgi:NitT/TauT family transport system permease protein/taurine transport system permease protein|nr:ABC transporter permease [Rhodospirillaceae bacterium]MBT6535432.1 ABC transporter permease [Rhodospirillaceae bacterium]
MTAINEFSVAVQRKFGRQRLRKFGLGIIPFIVLITLWHMNTIFVWFDPVEIPPIADVWDAIFWLQSDCPGILAAIEGHNGCQLTNNISSSIARVILAMAVGVPLGVAFGIMAGMNRVVSAYLEPIGVFMNSVSGIAWIPLAIVWFGVGWETTLFIMLNTIFWLLFFNTMMGVRAVPKVLIQGVYTLGGNRLDAILQVYLPGAMTSIITGLRMSMGFGWRALIAAEMIGGDSGLGFMIFVSSAEFKTEEVFLGVILISLIFLATDRWILVPLEKWTIERWGLVWKPT